MESFILNSGSGGFATHAGIGLAAGLVLGVLLAMLVKTKDENGQSQTPVWMWAVAALIGLGGAWGGAVAMANPEFCEAKLGGGKLLLSYETPKGGEELDLKSLAEIRLDHQRQEQGFTKDTSPVEKWWVVIKTKDGVERQGPSDTDATARKLALRLAAESGVAATERVLPKKYEVSDKGFTQPLIEPTPGS